MERRKTLLSHDTPLLVHPRTRRLFFHFFLCVYINTMYLYPHTRMYVSRLSYPHIYTFFFLSSLVSRQLLVSGVILLAKFIQRPTKPRGQNTMTTRTRRGPGSGDPHASRDETRVSYPHSYTRFTLTPRFFSLVAFGALLFYSLGSQAHRTPS